ncbi:M56 family metallopeptidase [Hymenobacter psychrophilus]|uniref:BlaR1 peptidase M56 n=1 Tax=Hymenobacter psychrophilus TaxID=651662 RepID=A0A1H3I3R4_9BACT|nr:M56 family metallopeptidase [Hymenobacter psychrophilus]SDY21809.1 BlaR1 peptidase M56 [Hymenobacter psychrophilus]
MSTPELLPYLLKVNGALVLFCGIYYLGLRRLTFFGLARAAPRPAELLRLPIEWPALALPPVAVAPAATSWLLVAYWTGVAVFGSRLLMQLLAVRRLHRRSRPQQLHGQPFRSLSGPVMPFAFWQTVYLNPARHPPGELPAILAHEYGHVRLWHTLDILLAQLSLVFYWFNPGGWLLRRALHENLEFQADYQVLQARPHEAKSYQYALLHQSIGRGPANDLVCHFNFHLLKNRIAMMNRPRSARPLAVRYLLLLPLVGALSLGSCEKRAYPEPSVAVSQAQNASSPENGLYFVDGAPVAYAAINQLDPAAIASMNVLKGRKYRPGFNEAAFERDFGVVGERGIILILTKVPANPAVLEAFNKKYNITYSQQDPADKVLAEKIVAGQGLTADELQGRLLIMNEKEVAAEKSKVAAGQLKSVFVMSPEQAAKKYGEKGAKGAVLIQTK